MAGKANTERFSDRVAVYVQHRPSYPTQMLDALAEKLDLKSGPTTIIDLGSGTGIMAKQLLKRLPEAKIFGVEPNQAMREAGDVHLAEFQDRFQSVDAKAEDTGLPSHSADLVIAAQAFHWFDKARARAECQRLLTAAGSVALVWNDRRGAHEALGTTPFMQAYELLLRKHCADFAAVNHHATVTAEVLGAFFGPDGYATAEYTHSYQLDFQQLRGRMLSSSYCPQPGEAAHEDLVAGLRRIFDEHQRNGTIDFVYDARVMYGRISGSDSIS